MAYVDPGTFASSAVLTAAQLNVVCGDVLYLKAAADLSAFTGVALLKSSSQSITSGPMTPLTWTSAPIDVGGTWWTSGSSITVPAGTVPAGYTRAVLSVNASALFDVNGTGTRALEVAVNGTLVEQRSATTGIAGETTTVSVLVWAQVADGDVVTIPAAQSSGASLAVTAAACHVQRIGAV